jgi:hypothetical protein
MGCHELAEHVLLLLLLVGGQSQCFLALIEPAGKVEERRYFIEDRKESLRKQNTDRKEGKGLNKKGRKKKERKVIKHE